VPWWGEPGTSGRNEEPTSGRQNAASSDAGVCVADCGRRVTDRHRVRCDVCTAKEQRQSTRLRATRAAAISLRRQSEAEWQGAGMDPERFETAVLPTLASIKLAAIVETCGVSKSTSVIVASRQDPSAPDALAELVQAGPSQAPGDEHITPDLWLGRLGQPARHRAWRGVRAVRLPNQGNRYYRLHQRKGEHHVPILVSADGPCRSDCWTEVGLWRPPRS
jgi:hypothetical protein